MTQATELRELASLLKVDSGNVGIGLGTDTPDQPLHVKGTRPVRLERAGVGEFEISIDNVVTGDSLDFVIEPVSGSVSAGFQVRTRQTDGTLLSSLSVNHDGKVGIGTIDPGHRLDVEGGNNVFDIARFGSSSSDNSEVTIGYFDANANNGIPALITSSDFGGLIQGGENGHLVLGIRDNDNTDALDIVSGGGNFMTDTTYDTLVATFKANGKVGIGTATPATTLNVESSSYPYVRVTNTGYTGFDIGQADSSEGGAALVKLRDVADMDFYTADLNRMRISSTGNVGIGLITTDPSHKLHVSGDIKSDQYLLDAVEETLTDTIVDAFIYDTRKDSDGGAWRKRVQHTSWYNETLSTSTRGSRKDFPVVAVIVATSNYKVIIYDGDDPALPMWMEFTLSNYNVASNWSTSKFGLGSPGFQGGDPSTVRMVNGQLVIGMKLGGSHGGYMVNFISELMIDMVHYGTAVNQFYHYLGNISQRNSDSVYTVGQKYSYGEVDPRIKGRLMSGAVYDVAMSVLPNAPIDPDTGLPNPTIALCTYSGITIIKDDLSLVNITTTTIQHETPMHVKFIGNRIFWLAQNNYDLGWSSAYTAFIPGEDITVNYSTGANSFSKYSSLEWSTHTTNGSSLTIPIAMNSPRTSVMIETDNEGNLILGGRGADDHGGVVRIRENLTNLDQGMIAHTATDYATGYQVGDIKVATLCSVDTTDITSSNLAGNGNFANTTVWFTQNGATLTVSGNEGTVTANGSTTQAYIGQTVSGLTVGKTYVIRAEAKRGTTAAQAAITVNGILSAMTTSTNFQPLHVKFVATATSQLVLCFLNGTGSQSGTAIFKNFTFRLAEEDRSKNRQDLSSGPHGGNALDVYGTVTKLPVATGAELQSYGNFSTSDYLERPCLSDFEFGTGDWSITGWVSQHADDASTQHIVQIGAGNGASSEISIVRQTSSNAMNLGFVVRGDSGTISQYPEGGLIDSLTFRHFVLTKRGDWYYWFVDGKVLATLAVSNVGNIGFAETDPFRVGHGVRTVTSDRMKISLLRVSSDPLSDEQIKYMYEEEKHLFQENAGASLVGTSNTITALAHDKETDLLHVGTSWGRSVFQGLRRIDEDLSHVPQIVIKASNGMIVEE
jgi:hypothetical protein